MDYNKNQELLEKAISGDEKATEELMTSNMGLVRSVALKFRDRGVEYEDLVQLGSIGIPLKTLAAHAGLLDTSLKLLE